MERCWNDSANPHMLQSSKRASRSQLVHSLQSTPRGRQRPRETIIGKAPAAASTQAMSTCQTRLGPQNSAPQLTAGRLTGQQQACALAGRPGFGASFAKARGRAFACIHPWPGQQPAALADIQAQSSCSTQKASARTNCCHRCSCTSKNALLN